MTQQFSVDCFVTEGLNERAWIFHVDSSMSTQDTWNMKAGNYGRLNNYTILYYRLYCQIAAPFSDILFRYPHRAQEE